MPQYSITIITREGRLWGTPWFRTSSQVRKYMKRKMKRLHIVPADLAGITMHTWRKGDTMKSFKKKKIARL